MTIQDLLDDLGISKGAFYHYFDSKPALLDAFIERAVDAYETMLAPIAAEGDRPPLDRLRRAFVVLAGGRMGDRAFLEALRVLGVRVEGRRSGVGAAGVVSGIPGRARSACTKKFSYRFLGLSHASDRACPRRRRLLAPPVSSRRRFTLVGAATVRPPRPASHRSTSSAGPSIAEAF